MICQQFKTVVSPPELYAATWGLSRGIVTTSVRNMHNAISIDPRTMRTMR